MSTTPGPGRPASPPRRIGRALRRACGARHEPLARGLDRSRSRAWLLTLLGAVLAAALATGGALLAYQASTAQADADRARLHRVDALVLGAADHPAAGGGRFTEGFSGRAGVRAAWTDPRGTRHTGVVDAPRPVADGSTLPVWVDGSGNAVEPPLEHTALAVSAGCTGVGGLLVLLALLVVGLRLRLRALDRRADQLWAAGWARLEPLWSGRASRHRED
ncbi:hypothetical protein [Streptomyces rubellomurinus]|uniref:Integral membrane protein n=2 Tax=Streptomyces TaxID=1883 RepID=A0A0F2TFZ2_STRR3|nr:hypothetical protein [Streptomyces rubellomurinus]KJS62153.1 hypothetical protein VM95_10715 [Streptomyces rubellomurinus]